FVSRSGHSLSSRMCQHFLVFIFAQYSVPPHIYALSLHDALPICSGLMRGELHALPRDRVARAEYSRALGRAPAQPVELGRERRALRRVGRGRRGAAGPPVQALLVAEVYGPDYADPA